MTGYGTNEKDDCKKMLEAIINDAKILLRSEDKCLFISDIAEAKSILDFVVDEVQSEGFDDDIDEYSKPQMPDDMKRRVHDLRNKFRQ